MKKVIKCTFKDGEDEQAAIFVKILNKIKDSKMESLTNLDQSVFFNAVEKSIDMIETIN
jgi:hypothetical protein